MDEPRTRRTTAIPALGPRGEGWTALQVLLMAAIVVVAWQGALAQDPSAPGVGAARGLGGGIMFAGLALVYAGIWQLRRARALSVLPRPLEAGSFVSSGPYRFIRHPIYAGLVLAGIGIAVLRLSPVIAALTLALFVVLDLTRRREEAWLLERYPEYDSYRRRTRALIPFLY